MSQITPAAAAAVRGASRRAGHPPWVDGNTGIAGFTTRAAPASRVRTWRCLALTHGNEIAGAIVLDRLLRAGLAPARGQLTFGFVNLAAFERFDPRQPTASRFVDEDINRVWDRGRAGRPAAVRSNSTARAKSVR